MSGDKPDITPDDELKHMRATLPALKAAGDAADVPTQWVEILLDDVETLKARAERAEATIERVRKALSGNYYNGDYYSSSTDAFDDGCKWVEKKIEAALKEPTDPEPCAKCNGEGHTANECREDA